MNNEILTGMAKAFFACAYADQADECGQPLTGEIMDQLPADIDPAAIHAARQLYMDFERSLGLSLGGAYVHLHGIENMRDQSAETFGHYAAMQAMGQGVGLWEDCPSQIHEKVPYVEFGSYSLEKDYFEDEGCNE
jgi:hypothetical protein